VVQGLQVGFAAQNIGGQVSFDVEKQDIPFTYRGGLAYKLPSIDLLFSLDAVKTIDRDADIAFGAEYAASDEVVLRLGNNYNPNSPFTPSFGIGFSIKGRYEINYAFADYADLGAVHRAGFTFRFKKPYVYKKRKTAASVRLLPPSNLSAKVKNNELILSWDAIPNVQYNIFAKRSSAGKWIKINKKPLYNNHLSFKKPKSAGILYFKANSIYNGQESSYSEEISIHVK
jgi:hypothetical protein